MFRKTIYGTTFKDVNFVPLQSATFCVQCELISTNQHGPIAWPAATPRCSVFPAFSVDRFATSKPPISSPILNSTVSSATCCAPSPIPTSNRKSRTSPTITLACPRPLFAASFASPMPPTLFPVFAPCMPEERSRNSRRRTGSRTRHQRHHRARPASDRRDRRRYRPARRRRNRLPRPRRPHRSRPRRPPADRCRHLRRSRAHRRSHALPRRRAQPARRPRQLPPPRSPLHPGLSAALLSPDSGRVRGAVLVPQRVRRTRRRHHATPFQHDGRRHLPHLQPASGPDSTSFGIESQLLPVVPPAVCPSDFLPATFPQSRVNMQQQELRSRVPHVGHCPGVSTCFPEPPSPCAPEGARARLCQFQRRLQKRDARSLRSPRHQRSRRGGAVRCAHWKSTSRWSCALDLAEASGQISTTARVVWSDSTGRVGLEPSAL